METNKHEKKHSSAFFWGFILGALFATLLTTKKGRQILRDLMDLALQLIEDFVDEKKREHLLSKVKMPENNTTVEEAKVTEDIVSAVAEDEVAPDVETPEEFHQEELHETVSDVVAPRVHKMAEDKEDAKNGHSKKRLFKGIKRK